MTVVLRPAAPADHEVIAAIWHAGWGDGHRGHVPAALEAQRDLASFRIRVPSRIPTTVVAERDGVVIGFVTVMDDEIEQVYVAGAARGAGVAASLMRAGEQMIAVDHATAWLAVVAGNARARRFYEKSGWIDRGDIPYRAETVDGTFELTVRRYDKPVR